MQGAAAGLGALDPAAGHPLPPGPATPRPPTGGRPARGQRREGCVLGPALRRRVSTEPSQAQLSEEH